MEFKKYVEQQEVVKNKFEKEITTAYPNLKYEITDDFVGVFDGLFTSEYCQMWRNHFDKLDAAGVTYNRTQYTNNEKDPDKVDDDSIDASYGMFDTEKEWNFAAPKFNEMFWGVAHSLYSNKFSILKSSAQYRMYSIKTQLTRPGGGYHIWHYESMDRIHSPRLLVFILYLNTIEEGGETEFLYLKKRVKPVEGRLLIWPAGFTHTHRGNPPLKDNKYIATGWLEF